MNYTTNLVIVFCILILTIRCANDELFENKESINQKFLLQIEDARNLASNLNLTNPYEPMDDHENVRITFNEISEEKIVLGEGLPVYYIFNFSDNQGFVIISSDFRAFPILAYSNRGYFNHEEAITNPGINSYLISYKSYINSIREIGSVFTNELANIWHDTGLDGSTLPSICVYEPDAPSNCGEEEHYTSDDLDSETDPILHEWGPLLDTEWGQDNGYDASAPLLGPDDCRAKTGCVATAMAQIIKYWEHPNHYDYSKMPNTDPSTEIANLMRDCGDEVDMDWGCDISNASTSDAAQVLKNVFGFSNDISYETYYYFETR